MPAVAGITMHESPRIAPHFMPGQSEMMAVWCAGRRLPGNHPAAGAFFRYGQAKV